MNASILYASSRSMYSLTKLIMDSFTKIIMVNMYSFTKIIMVNVTLTKDTLLKLYYYGGSVNLNNILFSLDFFIKIFFITIYNNNHDNRLKITNFESHHQYFLFILSIKKSACPLTYIFILLNKNGKTINYSYFNQLICFIFHYD